MLGLHCDWYVTALCYKFSRIYMPSRTRRLLWVSTGPITHMIHDDDLLSIQAVSLLHESSIPLLIVLFIDRDRFVRGRMARETRLGSVPSLVISPVFPSSSLPALSLFS